MQFGTDQPFPRSRRSEFTQYCAGAATNLKQPACLRKVFVGKADDQFITRDKPEMSGFEFGKLVEDFRIDAAHGIGKIRREHRGSLALLDHMSTGRTAPAKRPDRSIRRNRFHCAACKT